MLEKSSYVIDKKKIIFLYVTFKMKIILYAYEKEKIILEKNMLKSKS